MRKSLYRILLPVSVLFAPIFSSLVGNADRNPAADLPRSPVGFDSVALSPQPYIWPTDASRRITSSFAEYRSTHFHGGIDISTNGVKGYKVVAVSSGYVYRVRITPTGYGKMLFVKHDDGYISVYAHLQGFNEEITQAVRKEQYRRETYAIDLSFDSAAIRVKQGDVVAYSGDSGYGPPHLHFELRDADLNPVNPMLFRSYSVPDHIPPYIQRLVVSPLSYNSTVDNVTHPRYFSRFPRRRQLISLSQQLRLHGLIGFGVDAKDREDQTWNHTGIRRMEMFVDDSMTFAMQLDHVPAEETKQIDLDYDYSEIARGHGQFQKLYIDTGNVLPFYLNKPMGTGIINTDKLSEGPHSYKIACYDNAGNHVELHGTFLANHKPTLSLVRVEEKQITVRTGDGAIPEKFYVFGKRAYEPTWTQHTLPHGKFETGDSGTVLPIATKPYDVVKLIAETKWGSQSVPLFYFVKKPLGPARDIHIDNEVFADRIQFTLTTPGVFTEVPRITVVASGVRHIVPVEPVDVNKYIAAFQPTDIIDGSCTVEADAEINGMPVTAHRDVSIFVIPANQKGSFSSDESRLTLSFDSAAVYKPLCMQVGTNDEHHSTVYTLAPDDVLLNGGIRVSLEVPETGSQHRYALYYQNAGRWVFQTSTPDSGTNKLSATLRRLLGDVAVLADDSPPSIGRLHVAAPRKRLSGSFRYYDNLSGVDPDEIKMYLDNKLIIPEIDGEHRKVTFQGDEPLDRGRHLLHIVMKDRSGNSSDYSRTFSVR